MGLIWHMDSYEVWGYNDSFLVKESLYSERDMIKNFRILETVTERLATIAVASV